jgi:hypothetical protein
MPNKHRPAKKRGRACAAAPEVTPRGPLRLKTGELPLTQLLAIAGSALPPHFLSLATLSAHVRGDVAAKLREKLPRAYTAPLSDDKLIADNLTPPANVVGRENLNNGPAVAVILKCLGYLDTFAVLRVWFLHVCTEALATEAGVAEPTAAQLDDLTQRANDALALLNLLHLDRTLIAKRLNAELSLHLFPENTECDAEQCARRTAFLAVMPARANYATQHVLRHGTPSLVIAPSGIRIARFGLHVRGTLEMGETVAVYAGTAEREHNPAPYSGYRLKVSGTSIIDAKVERCLCGMVNDARNSAYSNNCKFRGGHGMQIATMRKLTNEEIFVSYGTSYSLNPPQEHPAAAMRNFDPLFVDTCNGSFVPEEPGYKPPNSDAPAAWVD